MTKGDPTNLVAFGRNVTVLMVQRSAHRDGSAVSGLTIAKAFLAAGARVHTVFGHKGDIIRDYEDCGISTSVEDHGNWLRHGNLPRAIQRIAREYKAAYRIARLINTIDADLVYTNSMVSLAGSIAGRISRRPVIWHLRELFNDDGGEIYPPVFLGKRFVRRQLNKFADRLFCVSRQVVDSVLEGRFADKSVVIPNTPDPSFIQSTIDRDPARRKFGFRNDQFVIGAIGSNRPAKGFDVLLSAFQSLAPTYQHVGLAIAGSGHTDEQLQHIPIELRSRIHFVGEVNPVRHMFDACDMICIPSRSESFGRIAVEAFCAARPVVATRAGGLSEIIEHGRTGLLAIPGDPESLRAELMQMISNPSLRETCRRNGILEFDARFTRDAMAKQIIEHTQTLLAGA